MSKIAKKKKIIILSVVLALVAIVAAVVIFIVMPKVQQKKAMESMMSAMQNRQSITTLSKMDLVTSISATGSLESAKTKSVSASANNMEVEKVYVSIGDTVKKGDKLIAFNTEDLEENLADVKENLAEVKEEQADAVSEAEESVTEAKEDYQSAKNEYKTAKNDERVIAEEVTRKKETMEQKEEAYNNAKKQLESAKKNRTKMVEEAQKKVDDAKEMLDNCTVTAPIAGLVTALEVEAGDTYAGGAIAQIEDVSSYTIITTIDEYDISKVKVGQRVVVLTETTGDDELEGKITFVSPTKGSSNMMGMNSGSDGYTVEIALTTKDDRLRLDLTAKCSIILEEATDVFAVAYDAVHKSKDGKSVLYVPSESGEGNSYTEVEVTTGMVTDYYVEISGEALYEGMRVIMETDPVDVSTEDAKEMGGFGFPGEQFPTGGYIPIGGNNPNIGMPNRGGNGGGMPSMPGR